MRKSVKELVKACQRLSALGESLTLEEWSKTWARFSEMQDKHLIKGEGLLDLEPLATLKPGVQK